MLLLRALSALAIIGLTTAIDFNTDEDTLKFEIDFRWNAGFQLCDKNWEPTGEIKRHDPHPFTWKKSDIGTDKADQYFLCYGYQGINRWRTDIDDKDITWRCTLTALKHSRFIHGYSIQGDHPWLKSKFRHEEAKLVCENMDGSTNGIDTQYMPIDKETLKEETKKLDKWLAALGVGDDDDDDDD